MTRSGGRTSRIACGAWRARRRRSIWRQGIRGVDLYISTFGPTLSVISEHWPVLTSEIDPKTGQPKPLRPDTALDLAREEVIRLRKEGLLEGRNVQFDPVTDWYVMAWDAFAAEEFPYDEARKLAMALGLEMDELLGQPSMVAKKGEYVVMQQPAQRRRKKGMVDPDAASLRPLDRRRAHGSFPSPLLFSTPPPPPSPPPPSLRQVRPAPEADILDRMRLAYYADELTAPPEEEPPLPAPRQGALFDDAAQEEDSNSEDADEEEDA